MADKQNGGYMYNQDEKDMLLESESSDDSLESSSGDTIITLHGITLCLTKGELLGICGAVGSGKTSIIQAILGMVIFSQFMELYIYTNYFTKKL